MEDENAAAATIHSLELAPEPAGDSVSTLSGGVASANSLSPVLVTGRRQWMPRSPPRGMYSQGEEDMESVESDDEGGYMGENRERRDSAPARLDAESTELSPAGSEGKQWRRATAGNLVSSQSILSDGLEDDDDEDQWLSRRDVDSDVTSSTRAVKILGVDLPLWCTRGPSWNRIASFVVRRAPCFWCCGNALEVGATDRSILYRLNVLCCFFTSGQVLSGIFLVFAFYSPGLVNRDGDVLERNESPGITPNLWNINGSIFLLAIIGTFGLITMFYTLGVVREVNLVGTIRYMWVMVWLIPLQIFVVISVVDYHRVTDVWLRHWWTVPSLAWFRSMFCRDGTFNTLCIVPVLGGEGFESEEEWCLNYFNVTNCADIRDSAQRGMSALVYFFYNINFVWGLGLVLLLVLAIKVLEGIITKPVVQSSRESNVPAWLTLPTIGSIAIGLTFLYGQSSVLSAQTGNNWVGVLFLTSGGLFLVSALLGWFISAFSILNSRDNQTKLAAVYLLCVMMAINIALIAAIFIGSILLSTSLVDVPLSDSERGRIACLIDGSQSCTFCDNKSDLRECPEWEENEVVRVLQTQLKQSATVAAIFWLYAVSALRFGFALRKHISMYEIDYV